MRELTGLLVELVLEARGFSQSVDRFLRTGEEVPTLLGPGVPIALQVLRLAGRGILWSFAGIETHGEDVEVLAHVEFHRLERAGQTREHLAAQPRALVVR